MKISNNFAKFNYLNFYGRKVNLLVYNDVHGSTKHINDFLSEQDGFYKQNQNDTNLTLCGGDLFLDESKNNELLANKIANSTDAIAPGNHDLEGREGGKF